MLDFRSVDDLRLHIPEQDDEYPLAEGVQGVARDAGGLHVGDTVAEALAWFCLDRRGVWLTLPDGASGVHVNGRRVRRMAMLRPGDSIYLDGTELILSGGRAVELPAPDQSGGSDDAGDARVVLRGVGGHHHGRSFTLERPRLVGRVQEADIRVEDAAVAERHAQLLQVDGRILLRDLGSDAGTMLNGSRVHDAWLESGDQLVFGPQHRFVVEAPGKRLATTRDVLEDEANAMASEPAPRAPSSWRRWPWLLLAALFIASALAALLFWGSGA